MKPFKSLIALVFLVGGLIGLAQAKAPLAAVGFVGLFCTVMDLKQTRKGVAFTALIPGIYKVPNFMPNLPADQQPYIEVPYMVRPEKSLYDQLLTLGRANPQTIAAIMQGGISFDPISYYIRYNVTGLSGRQTIVGATTLEIVGVTNFPNGATLPQFYNFCFDRIALRYAVATSANANVASINGWSSVRGSMPAALANAELIIQSNNNTIVQTPVSDFTSVASITGGGEKGYDGGELAKPRFFLEQIAPQIDIQFAQGQTMPSAANNTYAIELMFYGVQARLKY